MAPERSSRRSAGGVRSSVSDVRTVLTCVPSSPSIVWKSPGSRMPTYEARERSSRTGVRFYTVRDNSRPVRGQFAAQFAAQFAGAKIRGISLQNALGEHVGNREV